MNKMRGGLWKGGMKMVNYGQWPGGDSEVNWHVGPDFTVPYAGESFEQGYESIDDEHPALIGQEPYRNQMGPYAVPSFPWQQGAGGGHWQPYGQYPQMMPPYCMRCGSPWMGPGYGY